ncbi:MAG: SDR family NAD(P)-dependent oxidoreductase [Candidatus Methylacidiphilales bacterium]
MNAFANKTALVTGASAGLGAEFARQLAPQVGTLILTARRWDRLEALKTELTAAHPGLVVHHYCGDLAQPDVPEAIVRWLGEQGVRVDILVNNAGLGDFGSFATSHWGKVRNMLMVNMVALTELTHRLLPGMIERKEGTIINVSSTAGFLPIPDFAVYAATKAYVCSFTEALYTELSGTGVTVTALCPGPVPTEFGSVASRPDGGRRFNPADFLKVSPEEVVKQTLCGAKKGRARVIPGWIIKVPILVVEALPAPVLRTAWWGIEWTSGLSKTIFSSGSAGK